MDNEYLDYDGLKAYNDIVNGKITDNRHRLDDMSTFITSSQVDDWYGEQLPASETEFGGNVFIVTDAKYELDSEFFCEEATVTHIPKESEYLSL